MAIFPVGTFQWESLFLNWLESYYNKFYSNKLSHQCTSGLCQYTFESEKLQNALNCTSSFSTKLKENMLKILSQLGCRQMPTPHNLAGLIKGVAQYEFCCKLLAAVTMINSGLPMKHKKIGNQRSWTTIVGTLKIVGVDHEINSPKTSQNFLRWQCGSIS